MDAISKFISFVVNGLEKSLKHLECLLIYLKHSIASTIRSFYIYRV